MNKKYTKEFKAEAVKLVTEQGYSQAEAGRALGISDKNINRWVNTAQSKPELKKQLTAEQEEIASLRKQISRLEMEKEILKKAAAFFAKETS